MHKRFPFNYSEITDFLLIGTTPEPDDYKVLEKLGVTVIINMRAERKAPLTNIQTIWVPWLDIKFIRINPHLLTKAANESRKAIANKGKIYVYCKADRHRSAVMGSAILIAHGYDADKAMQLIKNQRPEADPDSKYIKKSILNFERMWLKDKRFR